MCVAGQHTLCMRVSEFMWAGFVRVTNDVHDNNTMLDTGSYKTSILSFETTVLSFKPILSR